MFVAATAYGGTDPIGGGYLFDKAAYLCTWREQHPENPIPLPYCDKQGVQSPKWKSEAEMQAWWQWMFNARLDRATPIRDQFLSDWSRYRKPALDKQVQQAAARASARRKISEAKEADERQARKATFIASLPSMSNEGLCMAAHEGHSFDPEAAKEEIKRRGIFSATEWQLIVDHKIRVGMSELGLICSWGWTHENRTVTAIGDSKQYVYPDGTYVYTQNGRVTALQDSR